MSAYEIFIENICYRSLFIISLFITEMESHQEGVTHIVDYLLKRVQINALKATYQEPVVKFPVQNRT